jgi:hypothetical protein
MTSSITEKGKGANADAVKVFPFSLAWFVFCVCSFLSFSRAVNRQLITYRLAAGYTPSSNKKRQPVQASRGICMCAPLYFAVFVWTDYVVLLRILVLRM